MKKRVFEFTCPNCGSSFFMARDTYLIKDAKSLEYSRLKDHTYFRHQCQNCKVLFDLDYPLIYRDGKRRFSLVLAQSLPQGGRAGHFDKKSGPVSGCLFDSGSGA